jgi:hypothetical protein
MPFPFRPEGQGHAILNEHLPWPQIHDRAYDRIGREQRAIHFELGWFDR